jgi:hypothetical protein
LAVYLEDDENTHLKIAQFFNKFEGKVKGYCFTILKNEKIIINKNIDVIYYKLLNTNVNIKIYCEENNKKNTPYHQLITKINLIDFCKSLGWDLNYCVGINEFEEEFLLTDNYHFEKYFNFNYESLGI